MSSGATPTNSINATPQLDNPTTDMTTLTPRTHTAVANQRAFTYDMHSA